MDTFLNWDHEINPTNQEDFLKNLLSYVKIHTGYSSLRGRVEGNYLNIEAKVSSVFGPGQSFGTAVPEHWSSILVLNLNPYYLKEVVGRVHNLGLKRSQIMDIFSTVT